MLKAKRGMGIVALFAASIVISASLLAGVVPVSAQDGGQQPGEVPQLFPPSGPYAVGRTVYAWADETRDEVHTDDKTDVRELSITVWYPAEPAADARPAPYMPQPMAEFFETVNGVPEGRLQAVRANAFEDAPLAGALDTYPVLVLDPGFSATAYQYSMMIEELASYGYVVFGMSHPYVSAITVYPDGRVVETLNGNQLRSVWAPQDMMDGEFAGAWVPDTRFVIEQIAALNADDAKGLFTGRLQTGTYGLLGHSQGARTISAICYADTRCAAAINMDGNYSAEVELSFDRPYMMMLADNGVEDFISAFQSSLEALVDGFYVLMIPRTHHNSFVDTPFWAPLVIETPPEGTGAAQIAVLDYRMYAQAFFDRHLRGQDAPLLDGASEEHPEVFFLNRVEPVEPPTAAADPQSFEGESVQGELAIGAADVWLYEGQAGEMVDILLLADRPADKASQEQRVQYNLLDTLLVVRAPDGSLLAANDDMNGDMTNSELRALELPANGTYQLEVRSWASRTSGGYTLVVQPYDS